MKYFNEIVPKSAAEVESNVRKSLASRVECSG